MNINKQQAMVSAEFQGNEYGRADWKFRLVDQCCLRNKFHRGSRCWHAFNRGYRRAYSMAARDSALRELVADTARCRRVYG